MPDTAQERTEAATPRRRSEARKDGNIARSQDLTAALALLAAVLLLYVLGGRVWNGMDASMRLMLSGDYTGNVTRVTQLSGAVEQTLYLMISAVLPLGLAIMGVALIAAISQVGLLLTGKPLMPKLSKLNPITGAKRLADTRALIRFVMSLGKLIIISGTTIVLISLETEKIVGLLALAPSLAMAEASHMVFMLALKLALLLLILAVADYAYQRWQHSEDLKMTKEDVRREMKDMDGDPQVKQRRAQVARQLAMQRVTQTVPSADVVVTNPTHLAIALKYDSETMRAPRVVAKGAELMAMRIRQLALQHGVPLVERKPLARALYAGVEIGQEVPPEHYAAVAEVLAFVYRLSEQQEAQAVGA